MKQHWLCRENNSRLVIFFTGWSRDATVLPPWNQPQATDLLMVYDYTTSTELDVAWKQYSEVELIAWSLGVWAAAEYFTVHPVKFRQAVAINGTLQPIDAQLGIAPEIFAGTIDHWLDERARRKFQLRMGGSGVTVPSTARLPEDQQTELRALQERILARKTPVVNCFDRAVVGLKDRIFPPDAQKQAWLNAGIVPEERDLPHYFACGVKCWDDLTAWGNSRIAQVRQRFARHLDTYEKNAPVQAHMAVELTANLCRIAERNSFDRILEIGCGSGGLTRLAAGTVAYQNYLAVDLVADCGDHLAGIPNLQFQAADAEHTALPGNYDLILSNAALQWFHDLPGVPRYLANLLQTTGVCAITGFGPDNLRELNELNGSGLEYWSLAEWQQRFENDFEILWLQEKKFCQGFASPREMLKQLKLSGVTASGRGAKWTKQKLADFEARYQAKYGICDGRVELTWHPIFLIARKK